MESGRLGKGGSVVRHISGLSGQENPLYDVVQPLEQVTEIYDSQ